MSARTTDLLLLIGLITVVASGLMLVPSAMEAQVEHNREIAHSRCIVNGDFDDSTEYCRAVAKDVRQ